MASWENYFGRGFGPSIAICRICGWLTDRGQKMSSAKLIYHMKSKHPEVNQKRVDALNILREKTIAIPLAGTTEDANANEDGNGNNDSGGVDTNKRHNATGKIGKMRGRVNMPPDAVIALVHAIKMHHNELRDHSKLDSIPGSTVRGQTWKIITDQLNARYGRELTPEQCMKKFLNIKTMVKYKLEEESRKRQHPGFENFNIRLTPAEQEYLWLFHGVKRGKGERNVRQPQQQGQGNSSGNNLETMGLKDDEDDDEESGGLMDEEDDGDEGPDTTSPNTVAKLMAEDDTFQVDAFGTNGSVTEALLGLIPTSSSYCTEQQENVGNIETNANHSPELECKPLLQRSEFDLDIADGDGRGAGGGNMMMMPLPSNSSNNNNNMMKMNNPIGATAAPILEIPLSLNMNNNTNNMNNNNGGNLLNNGDVGNGKMMTPQIGGINQQQMNGNGNGNQQRGGNLPFPHHHHQHHPQQQQMGGQGGGIPHPHQQIGHKRKWLGRMEMMMNGGGGGIRANGNGQEEQRLKRLKSELIEMKKLELMRREEWRLKKEFMLGRQTAALENVVILLREIRDKSK